MNCKKSFVDEEIFHLSDFSTSAGKTRIKFSPLLEDEKDAESENFELRPTAFDYSKNERFKFEKKLKLGLRVNKKKNLIQGEKVSVLCSSVMKTQPEFFSKKKFLNDVQFKPLNHSSRSLKCSRVIIFQTNSNLKKLRFKRKTVLREVLDFANNTDTPHKKQSQRENSKKRRKKIQFSKSMDRSRKRRKSRKIGSSIKNPKRRISLQLKINKSENFKSKIFQNKENSTTPPTSKEFEKEFSNWNLNKKFNFSFPKKLDFTQNSNHFCSTFSMSKRTQPRSNGKILNYRKSNIGEKSFYSFLNSGNMKGVKMKMYLKKINKENCNQNEFGNRNSRKIYDKIYHRNCSLK